MIIMEKSRLTHREKELLISLINQRSSAILNMKVDNKSNVAKARAWQDIEREFNRLGTTKKTCKQLRKSWENMKGKGKVDLAEVNRQKKELGDITLRLLIPDKDSRTGQENEFPGLTQEVSHSGDCSLMEDPLRLDADMSDEVTVLEFPEAQPLTASPGMAASTPSVRQEPTPTSISERECRPRQKRANHAIEDERSSMVERECKARLEKVNHAIMDEAYISEMRKELLMMDMRIKESEIARLKAKQASDEAEAKIRLAAAEAEAKANLEVARADAAAAKVRLATAEDARRQQRAMFEMQMEQLKRKMGSHQFPS